MYDFYTSVYPDSIIGEILEAVKEKRSIKPPKCIFRPETELFRIMIRVNIINSKNDTISAFLSRFGILDSPNWYLKKEDELFVP